MRDVVILPSALRRGHSSHGILHAVRNHIDSFELEDGVTMLIGPLESGALVEVGVTLSSDGVLVAIHCMNVRDKFVR